MKKPVYIALLMIMLMQAGGILVLLRLQQLSIKWKMAELVESEEAGFEELTLTLREFEQARINRKEILYKGEMYDIKSREIEGDIVRLKVINDRKEKEILNKIRSLSSQKEQDKKRAPDKVLKFFSTTFIIPHPGLDHHPDIHTSILIPWYGNYYFLPFETFSPPPELG